MALTDDLLIDFDFEELSGNAVDSVSGVVMTHTGPTPFDNLANAGAGNLYNGSTQFSKINSADDPIDSSIDLTYRKIFRDEDIDPGVAHTLFHKGSGVLTVIKRASDDKITVEVGVGSVLAVSNSAITDGQKIDLLFTVNGTTITLYMNGVPQTTVGTTGTRVATGDVFLASVLGLAAFSNITCTTLTAWQRALSAAEVTELHNGGRYKTFNAAAVQFEPPRITTNLRSVYSPHLSLNADQIQGFTWGITSLASVSYSTPFDFGIQATLSSGKLVAAVNKVFPNNAASANDLWTISVELKAITSGLAETYLDLDYGGNNVLFLNKNAANQFRVAILGSANIFMPAGIIDTEARFVFIKDGTTNVRLELNGVFIENITTASTVSTTTMNCVLMAAAQNGVLPEFMVWGRDLDTDESAFIVPGAFPDFIPVGGGIVSPVAEKILEGTVISPIF